MTGLPTRSAASAVSSVDSAVIRTVVPSSFLMTSSLPSRASSSPWISSVVTSRAHDAATSARLVTTATTGNSRPSRCLLISIVLLPTILYRLGRRLVVAAAPELPSDAIQQEQADDDGEGEAADQPPVGRAGGGFCRLGFRRRFGDR